MVDPIGAKFAKLRHDVKRCNRLTAMMENSVVNVGKYEPFNRPLWAKTVLPRRKAAHCHEWVLPLMRKCRWRRS
jgi:hypothetical protein